MRDIELQMLVLINFEAYISKYEYDKYQKNLNVMYQRDL